MMFNAKSGWGRLFCTIQRQTSSPEQRWAIASSPRYRGKWLLFFSHPADFTPVCASEFIAFANAADRFRALGCELLALSVDSLFSHFGWIRSIQKQFGVEITFPIIEDPSMVIARAYGMIAPHAPDSSLVRAAFLIDGTGIIRAITWYPMTTGRNVSELLRLLRRDADDRCPRRFDARGMATWARYPSAASSDGREHRIGSKIPGQTGISSCVGYPRLSTVRLTTSNDA